MVNLPQERISIAAIAVAAMRARARRCASTTPRSARRSASRSAKFQNTRFMLAEMATEAYIARVFVNDCVLKLNAGEVDTALASMAKWWTTELQKKLVDQGVQIHGGYGYMRSTRSPRPSSTAGSRRSTAARPRSRRRSSAGSSASDPRWNLPTAPPVRHTVTPPQQHASRGHPRTGVPHDRRPHRARPHHRAGRRPHDRRLPGRDRRRRGRPPGVLRQAPRARGRDLAHADVGRDARARARRRRRAARAGVAHRRHGRDHGEQPDRALPRRHRRRPRRGDADVDLQHAVRRAGRLRRRGGPARRRVPRDRRPPRALGQGARRDGEHPHRRPPRRRRARPTTTASCRGPTSWRPGRPTAPRTPTS